MLGPAFGLALQFYINHRFGLISLFRPVTYPDVICGFSCLILVGYLACSYATNVRGCQRPLAFASCACGALSLVILETLPLNGNGIHLVAAVGVLLFSFFFASQILFWFDAYSRSDNVVNLLFGLLATSTSGFLCWFILGLSGPRLICAEIFLIACSLACTIQGVRRTPEIQSGVLDGQSYSKTSASIIATTFLLGLGVMYATSYVSLDDFHQSFSWGLFVYALALCCIAFVFSNKIKLQLLYYLAAPLVIAGIVLALFDNPLPVSPVLLTNLGCFTYLLFVFVLHCSINHEQNKNPLRASSYLILSLYVGLFSGRWLFAIVNANLSQEVSHNIHAVISVVIIFMLIVCLMAGVNASQIIIRREVSNPRFDHITEYDTDEFAQRIRRTYKLTEREFQVLCFLLKEKTANEISESLMVAQGTVKAHISNIYKKLGVHSKEELFDMIPVTRSK